MYKPTYIPNAVVSYTILSHLENDLTVDEFIEWIEKTRKELKAVSGYGYDNGCHLLSGASGDWFSFSLHKETGIHVKPNSYSLHIWNAQGNESIGDVYFETDLQGHIARGTFREILERMSDWSHGTIHCSQCEEKIKIVDVAGHYFAGRFCKRCWETDWIEPNGHQHEAVKKIEARENYN